jgi:hypothetical protein
MEVIENFETFLESINAPLSDQKFRNYGHWKLGEVSVLHGSNCLDQFGLLSPLSNEIWKNLEYQNPGEFFNLSNGGRT